MRYLKGETYKVQYWDITDLTQYDYNPKQPIESQCGVYTVIGECILSNRNFLVLCTDKETSVKIENHPYRVVSILPKGCIIDGEPE